LAANSFEQWSALEAAHLQVLDPWTEARR